MKRINKYPTSITYSGELSETPIRINGMKVLFDEKIQLMPVSLINNQNVNKYD